MDENYSPGETFQADSGKVYVVTGVLNKSAMGAESYILKVRDYEDFSQRRILKKYKRGLKHREVKFQHELETLSYLNQHNRGRGMPGVVKLHDFSVGQQFIVLERIDGNDLDYFQEKRGFGNFALGETLAVGLNISRTLSEMFDSYGTFHRDLKPKNILVGREASITLSKDNGHSSLEALVKPGQLKLCDFTLSIRGQESRVHDNTTPGFFVGSIRYCSPELHDCRRGDAMTDVWALGVIMYDMLQKGGFLPSKSPREFFTQALKYIQPVPIQRDMLGFDNLLYRMLSKNPIDRPTMAEVNKEISTFYGKARGQKRKWDGIIKLLSRQIF